MTVVGSGFGKVILFGEHAVVCGTPAIAGAIGQGASATATTAERPAIHVAPWNVSLDARVDEPLARAYRSLLAALDVPGDVSLETHATVHVPGGSGLGGSAALGVAIARAVDGHLGRPVRLANETATIVDVWEREFHGNPSGIDAALAAAGGIAMFQRGAPLEPIRRRRPLRLVIGDSGEPCSTKSMVENVARQRARAPDRFEKTLAAITAIVRNGKHAVEHGDLKAIGQLFDMNQMLLSGLFVSTQPLEEMIAAAREAGALGAKLTGGGGGGCMIAIAPDEATDERVVDALRAIGKRAFVAEVGATGDSP